jgi:hypothetical protein
VREDPHSKLIVLEDVQKSCVGSLLPLFESQAVVSRRCGPVDFGCFLKSFTFDIRMFPDFCLLCEQLIQAHAIDGRPRRITSAFLSSYTTKSVCDPRDNRAMFAPHRDDGNGDDISLIFGLSSCHEYSGGILRVANTSSGSLWRSQKRGIPPAHKRGSSSYDVSFGRCCVLLNAEHSVQRLHWGVRKVAIVTAKPVRAPSNKGLQST